MMSQHCVSWVKQAVLLTAALLLLAPEVLAGEHVRAAGSPKAAPPPTATPVTVARGFAQPVAVVVVPVTISVAVTKPAKPAAEEVYVDLRGPDGQSRTFSVEGGPGAIRTQPVMVLHPGQSVTVRLALK